MGLGFIVLFTYLSVQYAQYRKIFFLYKEVSFQEKDIESLLIALFNRLSLPQIKLNTGWSYDYQQLVVYVDFQGF